jgi:hypothetical protein
LRFPYTIECTPAPLTLTIRPKPDWHAVIGLAWLAYFLYQVFGVDWQRVRVQDHLFDLVVLGVFTVATVLSFIRRERIEIYPDRMVWRRTYFGVTRSKEARLEDVFGAEWSEAQDRGEGGRVPEHVEFYVPGATVKACYGFSFEDYDRMREDIRGMYPDLIKRWGRARIQSKDFTLLNLS